MKNNAKSHHILYILLAAFATGSISPHFASAVSYQTEVTPTVTVNETLSLTVSSEELVISDLNPGQSSDSNILDILVSTNNEYGYTLTASVGNEATYNNTDLTSSTDGTIFSSLAESTDITDKANIDDNKWGYSFSINSGSSWSNYAGLPLYTATAHTLKATEDRVANDVTKFKIAVKAGVDKTAGNYRNVINFTVTANANPVTPPADTPINQAFAAASVTPVTLGNQQYYAMQDMTSDICSAVTSNGVDTNTQLLDTRTGGYKLYWVTKLSDGHCWMTQNLDLDLSTATALTSNDTDIKVSSYGTKGYTSANGYSENDGVVSWTPSTNTLDMTSASNYNSVSDWKTTWGDSNDTYNKATPQSMDVGEKYQKGTYFSSSSCNYITSTTCTNFSDTPDNNTEDGNGTHGAIGNYYNWTAAIATNNSSSWDASTNGNISGNPENSICPKGWRLPTVNTSSSNEEAGSTNEFARLNYLYNENRNGSGLTNGDTGLFNSPLYFTRAGNVNNSGLNRAGNYGYYWSSTVYSATNAYRLGFSSTSVYPASNDGRCGGFSVRCVAR